MGNGTAEGDEEEEEEGRGREKGTVLPGGQKPLRRGRGWPQESGRCWLTPWPTPVLVQLLLCNTRALSVLLAEEVSKIQSLRAVRETVFTPLPPGTAFLSSSVLRPQPLASNTEQVTNE